MRQSTPLLLSLLVLVGCPQGSKTASAPPAPKQAKSAPARSLAKTEEAKTAEKANEVAKLPQVTYYAFKG